MPPRVSRSSITKPQRTKPKSAGRISTQKGAKRALNAFATASHEYAEQPKIKRGRLGELEIGGRSKRQRPQAQEDEDGEEEEEADGRQGKRRRRDGDGIEEGSDSEGNNWTMGHVDTEDDSDIDSDEAFGESDEERFEGWTFRGSSSNGGTNAVRKRKMQGSLCDEHIDNVLEDLNSQSEEEGSEDDFGEDAIDLATALDQYEASEDDQVHNRSKLSKKRTTDFDRKDDDISQAELEATDDSSESAEDDEDDEVEEERRAQLDDLIASLGTNDSHQAPVPRKLDVHESSAPSEFGIMRKVDLASLKPKILDAERKKAFKLLEESKSSKRNDMTRKLDAPLPKRQQDKLDRAAASEKANETLSRWVDTVKQNRRAEHLSFPLNQIAAASRAGGTRLQPTTTTPPTNELESTIQTILQQSGLSSGRNEEEDMQKWEELQTNKMPLEEVMRRRAELRKERDLLFREEVRAKRIKKIKSKAYRRVHRKERERLLERERNALKADGFDVSEDEAEYNDRRRAEERMGAKHRESKWAKGVKATGRAAWDDDARSGVTEMARRNEELRRRIDGKEVRDENENGSDITEDDTEDDSDDADGEIRKVGRKLDLLQANPFTTHATSKLGGMAFMQKADAARKAQNDEAVRQLRKELAGEESDSDEEDDNAAVQGRRKYGPTAKGFVPVTVAKQSEFEERAQSSGDENITKTSNESAVLQDADKRKSRLNVDAQRAKETTGRDTAVRHSSPQENPYLVKAKKEKRSEQETSPSVRSEGKSKPAAGPSAKQAILKANPRSSSSSSAVHGLAGNPSLSAPDEDGFQVVSYGRDDANDDNVDDVVDDDDVSENGVDLDVVLRNQKLTATAFAGDNVEAEFEQEKKATIAEEDEQVIENVLPGWGAWTGDGMTSRQKARNKGLVTHTKKEGIAPKKRKDAKLDRVIINQKRLKANVKYMSSQLPFPFETREQYERSLRLPKGPEWTTKRTFQDATKPRLLVKQGIITPMHKPLV